MLLQSPLNDEFVIQIEAFEFVKVLLGNAIA